MDKTETTKPLGLKKQALMRSLIRETIDSAQMNKAAFDQLCGDGQDLPKTEKQVTAFIKERTRLYRESWIINRLRRIDDLITGEQSAR